MRMNWELVGGLVALAGAVLLAILVLEWVKRWVRRPEEPSKGAEIGQFRRLVDQGLLTQDEFARVQSAVEGRGRKAVPATAGTPKREEGIFDASARQAIRAPAVNEPPAQVPSAPLPSESLEESPRDGQPVPGENGGSPPS